MQDGRRPREQSTYHYLLTPDTTSEKDNNIGNIVGYRAPFWTAGPRECKMNCNCNMY